MSRFTALVSAIRRDRTPERRLRLVAASPTLATTDDIEMLVRSHGLAQPRVWAVGDYLALTDLAPSLVWNWVTAFDGAELADLLESGLMHVEVVEHLEQRSSPYCSSPAA